MEALLKATGAPRQVMFLDACRNDPGKAARARSFERFQASAGLRELLSTKEGRISYEDDQLGSGVFTHFLVLGLRGEAAGQDGLITFRDLADYVTDGVSTFGFQHGQMQVPYEAGESSGDFLLGRAIGAAVPPTLPSVRTSTQTDDPALPGKVTANGSKLVSAEAITEHLLPNGLRVLLGSDASKPKISVRMTYLVGTNAIAGEAGMAHLLVHLSFTETTNGRHIKDELKTRATEWNGDTKYDSTSYWETTAATEANLEWALRMEADRMANLRITRDIVEAEMPVIRNELEQRTRDQNGTNALTDRVLDAAFAGHGYGTHVSGLLDDDHSPPTNLVDAFYRKYYQPDNATLIITGGFDEGKALALISETFGRIPTPKRTLQRVATSPGTSNGQSVELHRNDLQESVIVLLYHAPAATDHEAAAMKVLAALMNGGRGPDQIVFPGHLSKALVDTQTAIRAVFSFTGLHDAGFVQVFVTMRKTQSLTAARRVAIEAIENFADRPPTTDQVESAKTRLLKAFDQNIQDPSVLAMSLSDAFLQGDWRLLFTNRENLASVTPRDVVRVAVEYLRQSNRTEGSLSPTSAQQ